MSSGLSFYLSSCGLILTQLLFITHPSTATTNSFMSEPDSICTDICTSPIYRTYYGNSAGECMDLCYRALDVILQSPEGGDYQDVNSVDTGEAYDDVAKKQKSSFVRIGRSVDNIVKALQISDDNDVDKRMSSFVRIGRSGGGAPEYVDSDLVKRASSFVRIGKSGHNKKYLFKRPSSFVRIGKKSSEEPMDKRMSSFVRIGKSFGPYADEDKRQSSFVRIGKASPSSFVRIGKSSDSYDMPSYPDEKRMSNFVRIGRPSSFVRIGKDVNDKRMSSFVRIGKKDQYEPTDLEKRMSSFVRIGKSNSLFGNDEAFDSVDTDANNINTNNDDKRVSSFVRIGKSFEDTYPAYPLEDEQQKRVSSFVRIGKSYGDELQDNDDTKRQSSFVRIGKDLARNNNYGNGNAN